MPAVPQSFPASTSTGLPLHCPGAEVLQLERLSPEALCDLSDDQLCSYIADCSVRMLAADARYQAESFIADKGERDRWWKAEQAALHERWKRPHIVCALEQEKGLA